MFEYISTANTKDLPTPAIWEHQCLAHEGATDSDTSGLVVDNEDPSTRYEGTRSVTRSLPQWSHYFSDSQHSTTGLGDSPTFHFTGTSIYYFTNGNKSIGRASISVDDGAGDAVNTFLPAPVDSSTWVIQGGIVIMYLVHRRRSSAWRLDPEPSDDTAKSHENRGSQSMVEATVSFIDHRRELTDRPMNGSSLSSGGSADLGARVTTQSYHGLPEPHTT
ncbi:unnamed protein product [Rhizoctonia solani]|uniref:Uncharacterized protein n=1 Tax=Rhizoctonia solani TaxID=456999 RepID=A0A8H3B5U5_9AGAM|nr:unnamed protein product [Rhizoctonia solani]